MYKICIRYIEAPFLYYITWIAHSTPFLLPSVMKGYPWRHFCAYFMYKYLFSINCWDFIFHSYRLPFITITILFAIIVWFRWHIMIFSLLFIFVFYFALIAAVHCRQKCKWIWIHKKGQIQNKQRMWEKIKRKARYNFAYGFYFLFAYFSFLSTIFISPSQKYVLFVFVSMCALLYCK